MFIKTTGDRYDDKDPAAYDPEHFYTLETGRENVQVRTSERVAQTIWQFVADPLLPHYQSKADFVRDAIIHRLHYMADHLSDPVARMELEAALKNETMNAYILKRARDSANLQATVDAQCQWLRDQIEKQQHLTWDDRRLMNAFWMDQKRLMMPNSYAEMRMLRLYFLQSKDELDDDPTWYWENEDAVQEWRDAWELRKKFWEDDNHTYESIIDVDEVEKYIDIRAEYHADVTAN